MDEQRQDNQLEHTHCSSVPKRDVAQKTCRKQWTIGRGGERRSGIARHDDDDDDDIGFSFFCSVSYQPSRFISCKW